MCAFYFRVSRNVFSLEKKKNIVRAVARKSTSKAVNPTPSPATTSSYQSLRLDESHKSTEHSGEIRTRFNLQYHDARVFEPHQCGSICVEDFVYAEGNFKSKIFFFLFLKAANMKVCNYELIRSQSFVGADAVWLVERYANN